MESTCINRLFNVAKAVAGICGSLRSCSERVEGTARSGCLAASLDEFGRGDSGGAPGAHARLALVAPSASLFSVRQFKLKAARANPCPNYSVARSKAANASIEPREADAVLRGGTTCGPERFTAMQIKVARAGAPVQGATGSRAL